MHFNLYKNYILFDIVQKFNFKNIADLPVSITVSVNLNNKKINSDLIFSVPHYLVQLGLLGVRPRFSHLSKAVSNFKTRGGELHGSAGAICGEQVFELLSNFLSNFFTEVSGLNPKIKVGFSEPNNFSIGFEDIKNASAFSQLELEYLNSHLGATINFSVNGPDAFKKNGSLIFFSAFGFQKNQ
jgi:large subunit ribosomal protein L5